MSHLGSDGKPFSTEELAQLELALVHLLKQMAITSPSAFSTQLLCDWHALISANISRMQPGALRQADITFGSYFGMSPAQLASTLAELTAWHLQVWPQLETAEQALSHATHLHAELIRIHPFWDGNGRLARAVQAWLCWQWNIDAPLYRDRAAYLSGLNRYHHTRDLSLLMQVTRAAVESPDSG